MRAVSIVAQDAARLRRPRLVRRTQSVPAASTFAGDALSPAVLAAHPDAALLAAIDSATSLKDDAELARSAGNAAYGQWIAEHAGEFVDVDTQIAWWPARTLLGARAKAAYALGSNDGPSMGAFAVAYAALRDLMALGDGPVPGGLPPRRRRV